LTILSFFLHYYRTFPCGLKTTIVVFFLFVIAYFTVNPALALSYFSQ